MREKLIPSARCIVGADVKRYPRMIIASFGGTSSSSSSSSGGIFGQTSESRAVGEARERDFAITRWYRDFFFLFCCSAELAEQRGRRCNRRTAEGKPDRKRRHFWSEFTSAFTLPIAFDYVVHGCSLIHLGASCLMSSVSIKRQVKVTRLDS